MIKTEIAKSIVIKKRKNIAVEADLTKKSTKKNLLYHNIEKIIKEKERRIEKKKEKRKEKRNKNKIQIRINQKFSMNMRVIRKN
jgi:hypothetical protein